MADDDAKVRSRQPVHQPAAIKQCSQPSLIKA